MKKQFFFTFMFLLGFLSTLCAQELIKIETYKCDPYPKSQYIDKETYDYRTADGTAVPPTLTDVLICDLWQRIDFDLKIKVTREEVTEEIISATMVIYLYRDWSNIAGYRPWTHSNFIKSLTVDQRKTLAAEVVSYIKKNGVKDVD
jgi:hypothetical protein